MFHLWVVSNKGQCMKPENDQNNENFWSFMTMKHIFYKAFPNMFQGHYPRYHIYTIKKSESNMHLLTAQILLFVIIQGPQCLPTQLYLVWDKKSLSSGYATVNSQSKNF